MVMSLCSSPGIKYTTSTYMELSLRPWQEQSHSIDMGAKSPSALLKPVTLWRMDSEFRSPNMILKLSNVWPPKTLEDLCDGSPLPSSAAFRRTSKEHQSIDTCLWSGPSIKHHTKTPPPFTNVERKRNPRSTKIPRSRRMAASPLHKLQMISVDRRTEWKPESS
jgi:hypothetical protein